MSHNQKGDIETSVLKCVVFQAFPGMQYVIEVYVSCYMPSHSCSLCFMKLGCHRVLSFTSGGQKNKEGIGE